MPAPHEKKRACRSLPSSIVLLVLMCVYCTIGHLLSPIMNTSKLYTFEDKLKNGRFFLWSHHPLFSGNHPYQPNNQQFYTIIYNTAAQQTVVIDEIPYLLPPGAVVPIMYRQHFRFEKPEAVTALQFNRDFYCVVNHDKEVGCAGLLFYGLKGVIVLQPDGIIQKKLDLLLEVFKDEFETIDDVQGNMLRMLLVRWIITLTRIARIQCVPAGLESQGNLYDVVRQFHTLVEIHFKTNHEVQFYAEKLFKSPKTLTNQFKKAGINPPLKIINQRRVLEARRMLYYTALSVKEIADELGFEDAANFTRFFKNNTGTSPSELRNTLRENDIGKN